MAEEGVWRGVKRNVRSRRRQKKEDVGATPSVPEAQRNFSAVQNNGGKGKGKWGQKKRKRTRPKKNIKCSPTT